MKALYHARSSAKKYGGIYQDYIGIHRYMDSSKAHVSDNRHRCIFHSSFGIFIISDIFGEVRTNSDGKEYSVRDIAEQHIIEDMGFIPNLNDYIENMTYESWMGGDKKNPPSSQKQILKYRERNKK